MAETIQSHKKPKFKCPDCSNRYTELAFLLRHVAAEHSDHIVDGITPKQYCFNRRNHKDFQLCVICKKNKTKWNEEAGHYNRFCSEKCKAEAGRIAEANLKRKTGMTRSERLSKTDVQKEMLHNRSISGEYIFRDNKTKLTYVGSYEHDFLRFYDKEYQGDPLDLIECDITFKYIYENEVHTYIPDFCCNLNGNGGIVIIEIKDGGDNPNMHHKIQEVDKVKEKLKDQAVINSKKFNFVKITNKEYENFLNVMAIVKERNGSDETLQPIISIGK